MLDSLWTQQQYWQKLLNSTYDISLGTATYSKTEKNNPEILNPKHSWFFKVSSACSPWLHVSIYQFIIRYTHTQLDTSTWKKSPRETVYIRWNCDYDFGGWLGYKELWEDPANCEQLHPLGLSSWAWVHDYIDKRERAAHVCVCVCYSVSALEHGCHWLLMILGSSLELRSPYTITSHVFRRPSRLTQKSQRHSRVLSESAASVSWW